MSLLRWKELAKSKSELGNKINYVHNSIKQHKIDDQTSKESFAKVFQPVTSKLDDVIDSDLRMPQSIKKPPKKMEVPNYGIDIDDEVEDMGIDDIFGEQPVPPQQEKQIIPPIYVYPPDEPPPEYDYDEIPDYEIPNEELTIDRLNELGLDDYKTIDKNIDNPEIIKDQKIKYLDKQIKYAKKEKQRLNGSRMAAKNKYKKNNNEVELQMRLKAIENDRYILNEYINNIDEQIKLYKMSKGSGIKGLGKIKKAKKERNIIKGYKAYLTKKYNSGTISEVNRQIMNKLLDDKMTVLNKYIKDHNKIKAIKKRGGNVVFFNDVKQLLKKLELIIGEVIAGNTSIQMRNTGVSILDMLLKMAKINRSQYNKLYNQYFKA